MRHCHDSSRIWPRDHTRSPEAWFQNCRPPGRTSVLLGSHPVFSPSLLVTPGSRRRPGTGRAAVTPSVANNRTRQAQHLAHTCQARSPGPSHRSLQTARTRHTGDGPTARSSTSARELPQAIQDSHSIPAQTQQTAERGPPVTALTSEENALCAQQACLSLP